MTARPSVHCDRRAVRAVLERWLDALRLEVPCPVRLDVAVDDLPLQLPLEAVFEQPEVRFARGPGGRGLRLEWLEAPAVADLPMGATTATIVLSPAAVDELERCTRTFLMAVLIVLLRRAGWHHLHAATAIDPAGRGWLVAGNANAGKSTTAALLASWRWRVGTDDVAFLEQSGDGVIVHTARAPIALREEGLALLARAGGVALPARGKVAFWPEELGGVWTPVVLPDIVIFTSVGSGATMAEPLARTVAVAELVRWSAWVMLETDLAQPHLDLLTRLARQVRCYRVTLGRDLFARRNRLIELVE